MCRRFTQVVKARELAALYGPGGLDAGHRTGGSLERCTDTSVPCLSSRRRGAAGCAPPPMGPGAVLGAGSVD